MTEAAGGRRHYNSQWAQEDVEILYNLLNNNNTFSMRAIFTTNPILKTS
jgi:hypothetical protein